MLGLFQCARKFCNLTIKEGFNMKYICLSMLLCAAYAQDNEQSQQQEAPQATVESSSTQQQPATTYDAEAQRRRDLEIQSYILPG